MRKINKTALVPYSAEQMFALVDDIDRYAEFLPWCNESHVDERSENEVRATLGVKYSKLERSFRTRNVNHPYELIEMYLLEGPFKHLYGRWSFTPLGNEGSKVTLDLEFQFSNKVMDLTVGPVFKQLADSMVDAFNKRAGEVYGG